MVLILLFVLSRLAWGQGERAKIPVFVSIIPQSFFLEQIGGNHVDVEVLIGEGQSPHNYEPTPKKMAKLAMAKAYFCVGVPAEKGIVRKIRLSLFRMSFFPMTAHRFWRI